MASSKNSITEPKPENRQAAFQAKMTLTESGASGLGGGADEAGEVVGLFGNHQTAASPIPASPEIAGVHDALLAAGPTLDSDEI